MHKHSFLVLALAGAPSATLAQTLTLTGDEAPALAPWTQPASITYVDSSESDDDKFAIDAALKLERALHDKTADTVFVRGVAHVSDQAKKQQELYKLQAGFHFERKYGGTIDAHGISTGALSVFTDVSVGWNSKATFPKPNDAACVADPTLSACGTQHQRSYRLAVDVQPFMQPWESSVAVVQNKTSRNFAYSFAPRLVLFHDEVTDAVLNDAGLKEDGGVAGAILSFNMAFSPPLLDHRLLFRSSVQQMQTFHRSSPRKPVFDSSSSLFKASVDYEFGARTWEQGWAPSIGVAYSSGEDPLDGRKDKHDVTVGLRLTYRGG